MQIDILGRFLLALLVVPLPALPFVAKELWKRALRIKLSRNNPAKMEELTLLQEHFALCVIYSDWREFLLRLSGGKNEIKEAQETATLICRKYREENPETMKNNDQIVEDARKALKKNISQSKIKKWKVAAFS